MGLTETFGDQLWPPTWPQTLFDLVEGEPDGLAPAARALRAQAVDLIRRDGLPRVTTFADVVDLCTANKVFHPVEGRWRSYAIDADRHPMLEPATSRRRRWKVVSTPLAPTCDDLPPLPGSKFGQRAGWLLLYGGSIDVLARNGVVGRLLPTVRRRHLLDIVGVADDGVWSVRNGLQADAADSMRTLTPDGYWEVLRTALDGVAQTPRPGDPHEGASQ